MKSKRITALFLAVLVMSILTALPTASAIYKAGKLKKTASVSFIKYEAVSGGIKWIYEVESGNGRARIRYWKLHSVAFKYYAVVDSSETVIQKAAHLKFSDSYKNGDPRVVWFTLGNQYTPVKLGSVRYVIYGSFAMPGKTQGPVMVRP